jgi:hypothetical protein
MQGTALGIEECRVMAGGVLQFVTEEIVVSNNSSVGTANSYVL